MKKTILTISTVCLVGVLIYMAGPYFRDQKHTDIATIDAHITMYDCAGERCIGFIADSVAPSSLHNYQGQLLLPYKKGENRDQLQEALAQAFTKENPAACLEGIFHKYSVDTLRLAHPAAGGYKLQLSSFQPGLCQQP